MSSFTSLFNRWGDKAGVLGGIVSAMGCAMCFPAIASIGAAIGLGFLSQWEKLFAHTLLPLFAVIALVANALGWFGHRQWHRSVLGMIGPILVLIALYLLWHSDSRNIVLYTGLAVMLGVAVWDFVSPANRRCPDETCAMPDRQ